jgi:hypothetical protein
VSRTQFRIPGTQTLRAEQMAVWVLEKPTKLVQLES